MPTEIHEKNDGVSSTAGQGEAYSLRGQIERQNPSSSTTSVAAVRKHRRCCCRYRALRPLHRLAARRSMKHALHTPSPPGRLPGMLDRP